MQVVLDSFPPLDCQIKDFMTFNTCYLIQCFLHTLDIFSSLLVAVTVFVAFLQFFLVKICQTTHRRVGGALAHHVCVHEFE